MSFSYGGSPAGSDLDQVRFLLADTDPGGALLSNEDIGFWLTRLSTVYGDPIMAAAFCAEIIAGRYAGEVSISADGVSYSGEQLQAKYATLAATLRATYKAVAAVGGAPDVGGIDWRGQAEPGVRPMSFGRGMHDNARAGGQTHPEPLPEVWPEGGLVTGP